MNLLAQFRVAPGKHITLKDFAPDATPGVKGKEEALKNLARNIERLAKLQYSLYAENRRSVLIVLQAMDAAGKDGVIRHVLSGLNPQGCRVTSFKVPSGEELAHDFLWRIHKQTPACGEIGVFNRSHYEDVLVVRVHKLISESECKARYDHINAFEKLLADSGVTICKFFLHVSREEQKRRLDTRLDDPRRNWKVAEADFVERKYWNDYHKAYGDALSRCSTPWAPWYVIPADHKWYRNYLVSEILRRTMESMDIRFPKPTCDIAALKRTYG
jgi:PPK2 family polyphosphate:nucleotide phosphotransferase